MDKHLNFKKILILSVAALFFIFPLFSRAQDDISLLPSGGKAEIYLFYSSTCQYCRQARIFLDVLKQKYSGLTVKEFNVSNEPNRNLWVVMAGLYGGEAGGVPAIFIGEEMLEGFGENMKASLEAKVWNCLQNGCISPIKKVPVVATGTDYNQNDLESKNKNFGLISAFLGLAVAVMLLIVFLIIKAVKKRKGNG